MKFIFKNLNKLIGIFVLSFISSAQPQSFPSKPVKLVIGFPAGGGVDATARAYALKLSEYWGQNVLVENKSGANGMIGAESVARSNKDGYTLFLSTPSEVALNSLLYAKMPYDPIKDLAPISLVAIYPNVIAVHPSIPVNSFQELIAYSKKNPQGINYASSGTGSSQHLAGEWLKSNAGLNWTHVPYKGAAPATVDLVGGQVQVGILGLGAILPHIKAGRLKAIAVTSINRSSALPEVATLHEVGIKFDSTQWYGILTTAGTSTEIISQIQTALQRASREPFVKDRILGLGGEPTSSSPQEYAQVIRDDIEKFSKIVKEQNIKSD
ncbi:MAG: tripartite tricarboxylate transporter substrate binding protein [Betaproteobacteria bacterium]